MAIDAHLGSASLLCLSSRRLCYYGYSYIIQPSFLGGSWAEIFVSKKKVVFVRGEAATGKKKKRGFVCRLDLAFRHKLMGFPKKGFKEVLSPEEGARS